MKNVLIILIFVSLNAYAGGDECDEECQRLKALIESESSISLINKTWMQPETLRNQCKDFPYFPNGGIHSAYCFVKTYLPVSKLESISGHKVFNSSPHINDTIVRTNEDFGRYNPRFLDWVLENVLPVTSYPEVKKVTEKTYIDYFSKSAKTYYLVYLQLQLENDDNTKIRSHITKSIEDKKYYSYEDYYYYPNERFEKIPHKGKLIKVNGNISKTAVPFWIRREIDGTSGQFIQALEKVFMAYEPEFLDYIKQESHNK
jgi:hypothetical protein